MVLRATSKSYRVLAVIDGSDRTVQNCPTAGVLRNWKQECSLPGSYHDCTHRFRLHAGTTHSGPPILAQELRESGNVNDTTILPVQS